MSTLSKIDMSILLDKYGQLLTSRQQEMLTSYCNYDCSLAEIASEHDISRQAVLACIQKCQCAMNEMEDKLHLVANDKLIRSQLMVIRQHVASGDADLAVAKLSKLIDEEID